MSQKKGKKSAKGDKRVNFRKSIYPKQSIVKTIVDFGSLADFGLEENKNYFVLNIKNSVSGSENVADEFSNYALWSIRK